MCTLTPLAALADLANKFAAYDRALTEGDALAVATTEEALEAALEATGVNDDYSTSYSGNRLDGVHIEHDGARLYLALPRP